MLIDLVSATNLDYESHVRLLRAAFARSAFSGEIARTFTPEFYRWKYSPPAGSAVVSHAQGEHGVAASVSAMPLVVSGPDGTHRAWQIVDIATAPDMRGRGYFRQCLEALCHDLPRGEILFCFPNVKSSPELYRQGFALVAELDMYARLILPRRLPWRSATRQVERPLVFGREISILAASFWQISRTNEYMNWRYTRHPIHHYEMLIDGPWGDPSGLAIVRPFSVFGVKVALFLELHGCTEGVVKRLVNEADVWASRKRIRFSMAISASRPTSGFLQVPTRLEPKRNICVARYIGSSSEADRQISGPWSMQIGDWDGV
jgi:GNAT superfamily N-acetyltransferase